MLVIDTPGLLDPEASEAPVDDGMSPEALEDLVAELVAPADRVVVHVEETDMEGTTEIPEFLRKSDPLLERTLFVRTKLDKALEAVGQAGGSVALNRHLSDAPRMQVCADVVPSPMCLGGSSSFFLFCRPRFGAPSPGAAAGPSTTTATCWRRRSFK